MAGKQGTHVLSRALAIIDFLALHPHGVSLTDIATSTSLPKSTAHRILAELMDAGYVLRTEESIYSLSFKVCELSYRVLSGLDILEIATPVIKHLCNRVCETVHLVAPSGVDVVYLRKDEPIQAAIRTMSYIGMRRPMYCTAAGKSMLAICSEEQRMSIWKKSQIYKFTDHTITNYREMAKNLDEAQRLGYAIDDEENEPGVRCVASAIKDHFGNPVGAISITAPTNRMTPEKIQELAVCVKEAANSVSLAMGYGISHN